MNQTTLATRIKALEINGDQEALADVCGQLSRKAERDSVRQDVKKRQSVMVFQEEALPSGDSAHHSSEFDAKRAGHAARMCSEECWIARPDPI